jgi:hypothetical protein
MGIKKGAKGEIKAGEKAKREKGVRTSVPLSHGPQARLGDENQGENSVALMLYLLSFSLFTPGI